MNHRVLRGFFPIPQQEQLLKAAFLRTPDAAPAWQEWSSRIDWVNDHPGPDSFDLLPFVYKNLSRLQVQDPLMTKLKGIYRYTWSKNMQVLRKHIDLLRCLHDTGVRVLLLDDVAVSVCHEPDSGVRRVSGLDVLVPVRDMKRVLASLAARGWYPEPPKTRRLLWLGHTTRMIGGPDRSFHLHWHVIPGCVSPGADEPFWDQAVSTHLLGVPVLVLSPTDALLRAITRGIGPNPVPPMRWVTNAAATMDSAAENMQ
ncbi:MAG: nucleotidyltransferase family protein, partial [Lentisphaerae bacterium]|nr:nucleotidyltransferase family protein [Lentisphaerota bacterium]